MTVICQQCSNTGANVLGIHAHRAKDAASLERWQAVHGDCFEEVGMTYGVDFPDIRARGVEFWVEHIGGKAWAQNTDYTGAFARVARELATR